MIGYFPTTRWSDSGNRQRRATALVDRLVKTTTSVFNLKPVAALPAPRPELPEDMLATLREFMRADLALYEHARAGVAKTGGADQSEACRSVRA